MKDSEKDEFLLRHLSAAHLTGEVELKQRCWFDVVPLHPYDATQLMLDAYRGAHIESMRRRDDFRSTDAGKLPPKIERIPSRKGPQVRLTALAHARRAADYLGIPYDFFCRTGMHIGERFMQHSPPEMGQLAGNLLLPSINDAWNHELELRIVLPSHPDYLLERWRGEPHQLRFQDWLCDRIETRDHPQMALASLLSLRPRLVREVAVRRFGESLVLEAERLLCR